MFDVVITKRRGEWVITSTLKFPKRIKLEKHITLRVHNNTSNKTSKLEEGDKRYSKSNYLTNEWLQK